MSSWTFYNAVRDAMRRMAAERDKPVEGTASTRDGAGAVAASVPSTPHRGGGHGQAG